MNSLFESHAVVAGENSRTGGGYTQLLEPVPEICGGDAERPSTPDQGRSHTVHSDKYTSDIWLRENAVLV